MIARIHPSALLSLLLTGLLGACGPGNTLSLRGNSDDARLKAVETSLQKAQEELKTLERKQAQAENRLAELQKRLGGSPEAKTPPPVPQGSALGVGFARPAATTAAPGAASESAPPAPQPPVPEEPAPPPTAPGSASPAPIVTAPPTPNTPPITAKPGLSTTLPKLAPETKPRRGRVGPPEPATPEAAIAADRGEPPVKAEPAATPPAQAQAPAATASTAPEQAASPTEKAADKASSAARTTGIGPDAGKAADPAEKAAYNAALQLAINGHQAEAKAAFEQFLTTHPQSTLTPNALYWIGEGAYQRGEYQSAIEDFDKVAKGWPGHNKAADSLYKKAQAQEKAGDVAGARTTLERYLKEFPNAELAGAARQKLQALPK